MTNTDSHEPIDRLGDFIAGAPLYSWFDLEQLWEPESLRQPELVLNVAKVYRYCSNARCRTERPFDRVEDGSGWAFHEEPGSDVSREEGGVGRIFALAFACTGCGSKFHCWVQTDPKYYTEARRRVRKVGQLPPWDISLREDLRDAFGEDAGLYKSAQECLSHSYGIATCAYLRRVLENRITPLLQTLREIKQEQGASAEDLRKIDEAMRGRTAEDRIRLANEALPESIKIAGDNPFALIYDRLSAALHRRDDQECIDVAVRSSHLLEYIVTNLNVARRQQHERKAYEEEYRTLRSEAQNAAE